MVIKERQEITRIDSLAQPKILYSLQAIDFVKFDRNMTAAKCAEVQPILDKIQKYLTYGCFYAHGCDLTRSLQAQQLGQAEDELRGVDCRYMWNYGMCKALIAQGVSQ